MEKGSTLRWHMKLNCSLNVHCCGLGHSRDMSVVEVWPLVSTREMFVEQTEKCWRFVLLAAEASSPLGAVCRQMISGLLPVSSNEALQLSECGRSQCSLPTQWPAPRLPTSLSHRVWTKRPLLHPTRPQHRVVTITCWA